MEVHGTPDPPPHTTTATTSRSAYTSTACFYPDSITAAAELLPLLEHRLLLLLREQYPFRNTLTSLSHLSLNREGRWGTTDDLATSFLHFSLFSTALWDLANFQAFETSKHYQPTTSAAAVAAATTCFYYYYYYCGCCSCLCCCLLVRFLLLKIVSL